MAMSVWPVRQARPAVSVTTTPTLAPVRSATARRSARALPSGSSGRSSTLPRRDVGGVDAGRGQGEPEPGPHDRGRSTPRHDPGARLGQLGLDRGEAVRAPSERPSALLTTLLVTSTTSPSTRGQRRNDQCRQVVAGPDLGRRRPAARTVRVTRPARSRGRHRGGGVVVGHVEGYGGRGESGLVQPGAAGRRPTRRRASRRGHRPGSRAP